MVCLLTKLILTLCLTATLVITTRAQDGQYINVNPPNFFNYNSPLRQPDSLRSRPYFDFLSTLYRRDTAKADLFRPYTRTARAAEPAIAPVASSSSTFQLANEPRTRNKRAIVFRPLFVYRQQQIKKQKISAANRRRS